MFTRQQAVDLWHSDDLIGIGVEADRHRKQLNPEPIVTYSVEPDEACIEYTFLRAQPIEQRLDALDEIKQKENATAFRPLVEPSATGVEYLKMLALSRLYLDDVQHLEGSWQIFGLKVAQISLSFGADDLGTAERGASEEELRRLIREAGYVPKQRDALFRTYSTR